MPNPVEDASVQFDLPGISDKTPKSETCKRGRGVRTVPTIRDRESNRVNWDNLSRMVRIKNAVIQGQPVGEIEKKTREELAAEAEAEDTLRPRLPGFGTDESSDDSDS